jgi:hypothetical protein
MGPRLPLLILLASTQLANANECKTVELAFTPAEITLPKPKNVPSQIVAWIEDTAGNYVDTIFITQQVGTFGLGNRPGRFDFNSGPKWPYGRRITVFPVWAHRRAASGAPTWQELVFQDDADSNLSHAFTQSTRDLHYCRPMDPAGDNMYWDAGTCATQSTGTDKGTFSTRVSLYPPRNDVMQIQYDSDDVSMFEMLNPFDAVSMATPQSGIPAEITWPIPASVPAGDYVLWFEISREFDHNATYSEAAYPSPMVSFGSYGAPYRGQPSVIYQVPFTIGAPEMTATTLDYAGYGDPDGLDGDVRPPDSTISTGVAGSGAERLGVRVDAASPYRLRVTSRLEVDEVAPAAPQELAVNTLTQTSATIELVAPGDDGLAGKVRAYEIRYVAGPSLGNFADAHEIEPDFTIVDGGTTQEFTINGLVFDTEYTVGIRATDDCNNTGEIATLTFRTPKRGSGEVDACFVATAAYGTLLANEIQPLRELRDRVLRQSVLGELAVEAYYTFGPAAAGVIGESEVLRASARAALTPIINRVK